MRFRGLVLAAALSAAAAGQRGGGAPGGVPGGPNPGVPGGVRGGFGGGGTRGQHPPGPTINYYQLGNPWGYPFGYPGFPGAGDLCFTAGWCNQPYYPQPYYPQPYYPPPYAAPAMAAAPPTNVIVMPPQPVYAPPPEPEIRNEPAAMPVEPAALPAAPRAADPPPRPALRDQYPALIVLKTGWVYSVRSYSVKKGTLRFTTTQGDRLSVPASRLERVYPGTGGEPAR